MLNINDLIKELNVGDYGYDFENYDGSTYISDAIIEIADNNTSIYYSDIYQFIKDYTEYVERAIDEFGWDGCGSDLMKAGQMGEYLKITDDLYDNLNDVILNYAYKYYVDKTDNIMIDDELNKLLTDYCDDVDHNDYLSDVTDIIENYLNDESEA